MATTANPPPGAIPTNGAGDPFVGPGPGVLRYAGSFDTDTFASNSPSQAKRALEAHLKDTDRRIQDASRLGSTLVQQRKELAARLEDVRNVQATDEVPAPLRKKLVELEREYNEIGKESARAFLPKAGAAAAPTEYNGVARESPTKVSAPSRRQRNQPSNRVHDIEFATEISTSLLAQVRQLQAALAEKDDALREVSAVRAQLEQEAEGMVARIKQMGDSEQRARDENWNLEVRVQELEGELRETVDKHDRVSQGFKGVEGEKSAALRELEELRLAHDNLQEDHAQVRRQQEGDLHTLRRDVTVHQTEKEALQRKVEELTSQNAELARAVSSRWNQHDAPSAADAAAALSDRDDGNLNSDDGGFLESPVKGTPARHGHLESETLRSSLNHAHRMIQNLKNNIHREKTEKSELKRLLQDAREELDARRSIVGGADGAKKPLRRSEDKGFKKPARLDRAALGANRSSTTEILEDEPEWEEHDGTPSKSRYPSAAAGASAFDFDAFGGGDETETTDTGFETARETERESTTEAFETSHEGLAGDSSEGDLTETEGGLGRSGTVRAGTVSPMLTTKAAKRRSLQSTASTSADEGDEERERDVRTPVQSAMPKYRLRLNRNGVGRRSGRVSDMREASPSLHSPGSSIGTGTPQPAGQSLGDELDALEDGSSLGGTPSRMSAGSPETERLGSVEPTTPPAGEGVEEEAHEPEISSPTLSPVHPKPEGEQAQTAYQANVAMLAHERMVHKAVMVDTGVMTEPWEPEVREVVEEKEVDGKGVEEEEHQPSLRERAGEVVGGALAGFGLGRIGRKREGVHEEPEPAPQEGAHEEPPHADDLKDGRAPEEQVQPGASAAERVIEEREKEIAARKKEVAEREKEIADLQQKVRAAESGHGSQERKVRELEEHLRAVSVAAQAKLDEQDGLIRSREAELQALQGQLSTLQSRESMPATKQIRPVASSSELPMALTGMQAEPQPVLDEDADALFAEEPKSLTEAVSEPLREHHVAPRGAPVVALQYSGIVAQEMEPVLPEISKDVQRAIVKEARRHLDFSTVDAQDYEPDVLPPTPLLPKRSSRRMDLLYDDEPAERETDVQDFGTDEIPGTEAARAGAGFFASMAPPPLTRKRSRSMPVSRTMSSEDESLIEPKVFGGVREGSSGIPTLVFGGDDEETHFPLSAVSANVRQQPERNVSTESMIPLTKPLQIKKPMVDEGAQTVVSGTEIDDMLRDKSRTSSMTDTGLVPSVPGSPTQRRSIDGMAGVDPLQGRGPRRPPSAGSMRSRTSARIPPPLPEDFTEKIVAAEKQKGPATPGPAAAGTMGPPTMPASAYKQNKVQPRTPGERVAYHERNTSRDGTTPRPVRHRDSRNAMQSGSGVSRRTSVSSFASELDERFNITRADIMYPGDVAPSTDPRMIQAITQTMIGEYLWKYTRKAGRSETSTTRHRRFFWIHPYTRTLYWSEQDPSTAGKNMLKAKSMAIQSVRVITDDNTYPPGLHRKSIVVVTPGRDVVFTAPTGQRHETWFNALSYLLLRTEQEKQEATDTINEEDLEEFNPGFSLRRSISRMTGRDGAQSRASLSSYNSRGTRTSSPQRRETGGSLAQRQSQATLRARGAATPTPAAPVAKSSHAPADTTASRTDTMRSRTSMSGRFSSLTSRFRSASSQRGNSVSTRGGGRESMSMRSRTGDPSDIYDASVVSDSAEDLRAVIERQEKDADRLENVRACCDGKHDVGSISRHGKGRHSSLTSRFGSQTHSHGHAHPRAEPIKESQRPRRGE